jgi:TonB family protein
MGDARPVTDRPLGSLGFLLERDPSNGRTFRLGVMVAILVHAAVFAVHWPTLAGTPSGLETESKRFHVIRQIRFVRPERPVTRPTTPRVRRVPIPDPTPFDPEPARDPSPPVDVEFPEDIVFPGDLVIPEPPQEVVRPTVHLVGGRISPPAVTHRLLPVYTEAARRARIEGAVILQLVIDTEGSVQEMTVLRGLPLGLTEAAVTAVEQWRFEPSTLSGRPVAVRYTLTVWFNLESQT